MRHNWIHRQLGRNSEHRWAMLRTMVSQLIHHERIETTLPKAKELRKVADRMVTLGKEGTLSAIRRAEAVLRTDDVLHKLFYKLAPRYKERHGGYTRVVQTRHRHGDKALMAYIEFVDRPDELRAAKPPTTPPPPSTPLDPWVRSKFASITLPYRPSRALRDKPDEFVHTHKRRSKASKHSRTCSSDSDGEPASAASSEQAENAAARTASASSSTST